MRRLFLNSFLYIFVCMCSLFGDNDKKEVTTNKVIVVVNGNVITKLDVENRIKIFLKLANVQIPENEKEGMFANMLKVMIDELLKLQKVTEFIKRFNDNKPLVSLEEIDKYFNNILKQSHVSQEEFNGFLKENNIAMDSVYRQIDANLSWVQFIVDCFSGNIQISDSEVTSYINQLEESNKCKTYILGRIVVPFTSTNEDEARAKINEAMYYLSQGVAFELVANNFSSGAEAQNGGFVGAVRETQLKEEELTVIASMGVGNVSKIIKNDNEFVIYKVYNVKAQGGNSLTKITAQRIEFSVPREKMESVAEEVLYNSKNVDNFLLTASLDKRAKIYNDEEFIVEEMRPEVQGFMIGLTPGTISAPVPTQNGFSVFYTKSKEIVNNNIPSFEEVKRMIRNKKLESIAKKQFQEVQVNAYIKYMD